jgi:class 3 adenylate cyclase
MIDDPRTDVGDAAYRGFLFADMRGFTAFAERRGNAEAAAAVGRFLEIARTAIARYDGAEIKTEGDAIHAVFPSASGAVLCGLEIVELADELNANEPGRQIGLGVGVHAGEAVETAEGYIGRAVNIAARLCAVARPGEVLVSSTVKGITQASIPVGFIPRGRKRLKGIQDPILAYAVTRDPTARTPRDVPRAVVLGGAGVAVALALVLIAAFVGSQLLGNPSGSASTDGAASASTAPVAQPIAIGPLPIGTYTSQQFQPPFTFSVVDLYWSANRDSLATLGLIREAAPRGGVFFLRVDEVIANPCIEDGEGTNTGPGAADLLTQLGALDHLEVANHEAVEVGGFVGQQVDVTVSDGVLAACGGLAGAEAALFRAGNEVWSASPGERFRLISVDVDGQALTLVLSTDWSQTRSVQELESLLALGQRIIDSVAFPIAP